MERKTTKARFIALIGLVAAAALATGPASSAKIGIPELGGAVPPAAVHPAPIQRSRRCVLVSNGMDERTGLVLYGWSCTGGGTSKAAGAWRMG